ncbi:MAG TPA: hypothetical protein VGK29_03390 [Paludibaculum sp.]
MTHDTAATGKPRMRWVTSFQSGFADTFQLTLGGMFGVGPAWQNKFTTGLTNVLQTGDSVYIYGSDTMDSPTQSNDWQAGMGYKAPVWRKRNHFLSLGSGVQHWRFPSVKTGTNDWLIPGNLLYQTKVKAVPVAVQSDSWTLLKSPLAKGSLLHTQVWMSHPILKRDQVQVVFKHGPAHTYSWNFYGTQGNRVFRYQTMVAISFKDTVIEGGYRKQVGLQDGIQNNNYWQFAVTKTFSR